MTKGLDEVHIDLLKPIYPGLKHLIWPAPQEVISVYTLGRIIENYGYDVHELNEPPLESNSPVQP